MIRLLFFLLKFLRWEMVCLKSGCWHNRLTEHRLCLMNNDDVLCEFLRVKKGILNDVVSIKGSMAPQSFLVSHCFFSPCSHTLLHSLCLQQLFLSSNYETHSNPPQDHPLSFHHYFNFSLSLHLRVIHQSFSRHRPHSTIRGIFNFFSINLIYFMLIYINC